MYVIRGKTRGIWRLERSQSGSVIVSGLGRNDGRGLDDMDRIY
jgi:hypothetical protein